MSAASNDNEQGSDMDEPMGSQSQVRARNVFQKYQESSNIIFFHAITEKNSEFYNFFYNNT